MTAFYHEAAEAPRRPGDRLFRITVADDWGTFEMFAAGRWGFLVFLAAQLAFSSPVSVKVVPESR